MTRILNAANQVEPREIPKNLVFIVNRMKNQLKMRSCLKQSSQEHVTSSLMYFLITILNIKKKETQKTKKNRSRGRKKR